MEISNEEIKKRILEAPLSEADKYVLETYGQEDFHSYRMGSLLINDRKLNELINNNRLNEPMSGKRVFTITPENIKEEDVQAYLDRIVERMKRNPYENIDDINNRP